MDDDTACFGRVVFERVGGITLCVRGKSVARFNLRDMLWQMGQDPDWFTSALFNGATELSDWIAQAERRRAELGFDDAVTTEADAVAEPVVAATSSQMPSAKPSDGITYARDDVVAGLTSFYKFLAGLHIPESLIVYPPPGGWPMISKDGFPKCSKNDTVLDLVRHIPYIRYPYGSSCEIYEGCSAVDYRAHFKDDYRAYDPFGDAEHELNRKGWTSECNRAPPAHVVVLGSVSDGHGHFLMVDTKEGKAAMNDRQARRSGPWYPIMEFFEIMKEHYRVVKVLPHSGMHVAGYGLEMIQ
ncbi:hypothetical protein B0J12DRAFT_204265 [Macrophomina phaseolina]|uniref:Peptidase C78 ubiquitin fold modifier-specific peptidase 1/ 2 n=1 Tax=Macrophomina phaseolina TaxID=35725 RepID=A0ABQ8G2L1_9PEZI|nr:hypothetical protein B0J12DRAFT_204265 [Macrophomina phaseolina]